MLSYPTYSKGFAGLQEKLKEKLQKTLRKTLTFLNKLFSYFKMFNHISGVGLQYFGVCIST